MKNENQVNSRLSKEIRKVPDAYCIKTSDKFTVGIADFIIWHKGKAHALENKFIEDWPAISNRLLTNHIFTGPQITFLESVYITGNPSWGGIYVDTEKTLYLANYTLIPQNGNWNTGEFKDMIEKGKVSGFKLDDTNGILNYMGAYKHGWR